MTTQGQGTAAASPLKLRAGNPHENALAYRTANSLLLLSVLVGACLAIISSARLIAVPYEIDYGEGAMLDGAERIWHSQPLYPSPYAFPVVLHMYGPVAYAAVAAVLPGGRASLPAGRLLILTCCVILSLLLSCILRRWTASWKIALSFGCLVLTLPAFRFWLYLLRADEIGLLFSILGVGLYVWTGKPYWSVPLFGLAIFCKYTLIAAPLAVLLHLIVNRKLKQGTAFAAELGFAGAVACVVLQFATGHWFAVHMLSIHADRYSLAHFLALAALVWASAPAVTGLALWYVAQDFRHHSGSFAAIYFATSSVTALSAGKLGATTNHFLEWMTASCLCAGLGYALLAAKLPTRLAPITALLSVSLLVGVVIQDRTSYQTLPQLTECGNAYQYVRDSPSSRILSESLSPLLIAGKPILVSDPFAYGQLVKNGRWSDRRVEQLVNQKYFDLIVLATDPSQMKPRSSEAWSGEFMDAVIQNYRTVARFRCRGAGVMLKPTSTSLDHAQTGASALGSAATDAP